MKMSSLEDWVFLSSSEAIEWTLRQWVQQEYWEQKEDRIGITVSVIFEIEG